ncbi:Tn3 family transposase [Legionella pneumophila]|nr:Tn3 family transposase [Legionella pneumophila]
MSKNYRHTQSNDTLRALIELDQVIMTLYLLDYIDDEGMRKTVHRSLNRVSHTTSSEPLSQGLVAGN